MKGIIKEGHYQQTIREKIQQRRFQMFIHSFLYYHCNTNIISDAKWSEWAMELVDLQKKYPRESTTAPYYKDFKDWNGSTGADLKIPEKFQNLAAWLYKMNTGEELTIIKLTPKPKKKVGARKKKKTVAKPLF